MEFSATDDAKLYIPHAHIQPFVHIGETLIQRTGERGRNFYYKY